MWIHQRACEMNTLIYSVTALATRGMPRAEPPNGPPLNSFCCVPRLGSKASCIPSTPPIHTIFTLLSSEAERPLLCPPAAHDQALDSGERRVQPLSRGSPGPASLSPRAGSGSGSDAARYLCTHLQTKARRPFPTFLTLASRAGPRTAGPTAASRPRPLEPAAARPLRLKLKRAASAPPRAGSARALRPPPPAAAAHWLQGRSRPSLSAPLPPGVPSRCPCQGLPAARDRA